MRGIIGGDRERVSVVVEASWLSSTEGFKIYLMGLQPTTLEGKGRKGEQQRRVRAARGIPSPSPAYLVVVLVYTVSRHGAVHRPMIIPLDPVSRGPSAAITAARLE
jgi:hypothetical protein